MGVVKLITFIRSYSSGHRHSGAEGGGEADVGHELELVLNRIHYAPARCTISKFTLGFTSSHPSTVYSQV